MKVDQTIPVKRDPTSPASEFLLPFEQPIAASAIPEKFISPFARQPHPISLEAARQLQRRLQRQQEWSHNFGLVPGMAGMVIGKMFGVLVVRTAQDQVGYLAAFSGKLAGGFHHAGFVPPVFDSLAEGSFLNSGMTELTHINQQIKSLEYADTNGNAEKIAVLQQLRKSNSAALQDRLYDQYHFLNQAGETRGLREIFRKHNSSNPPAGAGECAAPKLLQHAFRHHMQPLAMAEFWWGLSPKSDYWKHGHFYPACREKCVPILAHMLQGIALDAEADRTAIW